MPRWHPDDLGEQNTRKDAFAQIAIGQGCRGVNFIDGRRKCIRLPR